MQGDKGKGAARNQDAMDLSDDEGPEIVPVDSESEVETAGQGNERSEVPPTQQGTSAVQTSPKVRFS